MPYGIKIVKIIGRERYSERNVKDIVDSLKNTSFMLADRGYDERAWENFANSMYKFKEMLDTSKPEPEYLGKVKSLRSKVDELVSLYCKLDDMTTGKSPQELRSRQFRAHLDELNKEVLALVEAFDRLMA